MKYNMQFFNEVSTPTTTPTTTTTTTPTPQEVIDSATVGDLMKAMKVQLSESSDEITKLQERIAEAERTNLHLALNQISGKTIENNVKSFEDILRSQPFYQQIKIKGD